MILGQLRAFMEIWTGVTNALRTDGLTLKDRDTQLLIKYKSGAHVTQKLLNVFGRPCHVTALAYVGAR